MSELSDNKSIRVRFAPSPTGSLHIGGARTALFNWLFARNNKGEFFLRIEDTDKKRSSGEMVDEIIGGLRWLGLNFNGNIVYQSSRLDIYRKFAQELLDNNKAYQCYCEKPEAESVQPGDESSEPSICECYLFTSKEREEHLNQGIKPAIRFWVPEGSVCFDDLVYGSLEFENAEMENFVILRADGTPTYHLAVVVADHDMAISHVIRGEDHLTNTPKQILLYYALDWHLPEFAHLPLILGPDKKRLSKRHGASSIEQYSKSDILPEALVDYIEVLGWSPGEDKEIMSENELINLFSLERISKKSAVFDSVKLEWVNSEYIKKHKTDELVKLVIPYLIDAELITEEEIPAKLGYLKTVVDIFKSRMKTMKDLSRLGKYFFKDPENYDGNALKKYWTQETKNYLDEFNRELAQVVDFSAENIETVLREFCTKIGIPAAKLIHPIRIVITGFAVSPGLFEMIEAIGKETVMQRIEKGIETI